MNWAFECVLFRVWDEESCAWVTVIPEALIQIVRDARLETL